MKKNIVGRIITVLVIVSATIQVGVTIGYYMLANIDFNKYNTNYNIEIVR